MDAPKTDTSPTDSKVEETVSRQQENDTGTDNEKPVSDNNDTETKQDTSVKSHAPALGSKIQVLWRIIHDDMPVDQSTTTKVKAESDNTETATEQQTGETTGTGEINTKDSPSNVEERWWGAVVQECTSDIVGSRCPAHANLNIHLLLYDAYGDFEEEIVKVAFLPDNVLLDLSMLDDSSGGRLDWQYEDSNANADVEMNNICSAEHLAREADELVQQSGISADADLHALSSMPHDVQLHVASGYRSFADSIKRLLGELINSKPTGYVVTADDVQSIMARVRLQQRQRTEAMAGEAAL